MTPALPQAYLERMRAQLGDAFPDYLSAMEQPPRRALRVNTLKTAPETLLPMLGGGFTPDGVCPEGFLTPAGFLCGRHPLHQAGLFYMQEASAQLPALLTGAAPGMAVLDLCAAPGGKSTQLAAMLQGRGVLLSNEIDRSRASVLANNLERMGVANAVVTSMSPAALSKLLPEQFDAVLVDAPCAGEGMFRKEPQAVSAWSEAHVTACAARQREILASAADTVKPGGRLVYATCSFSPEENEQTVQSFLSGHPDFSLLEEHRLYPHTSSGEGQYAALMVRSGARAEGVFTLPRKDVCAPWDAFQRESLLPVSGAVRVLNDGRVLLLPTLPFPLEGLWVVRAGVLLGNLKDTRLEPAHALALMGKATPFRTTHALSEADALRYLSGQTLPGDGVPKGYLALTLHGYALGIGKASDGVIKNKLPKGLRLV